MEKYETKLKKIIDERYKKDINNTFICIGFPLLFSSIVFYFFDYLLKPFYGSFYGLGVSLTTTLHFFVFFFSFKCVIKLLILYLEMDFKLEKYTNVEEDSLEILIANSILAPVFYILLYFFLSFLSPESFNFINLLEIYALSFIASYGLCFIIYVVIGLYVGAYNQLHKAPVLSTNNRKESNSKQNNSRENNDKNVNTQEKTKNDLVDSSELFFSSSLSDFYSELSDLNLNIAHINTIISKVDVETLHKIRTNLLRLEKTSAIYKTLRDDAKLEINHEIKTSIIDTDNLIKKVVSDYEVNCLSEMRKQLSLLHKI